VNRSSAFRPSAGAASDLDQLDCIGPKENCNMLTTKDVDVVVVGSGFGGSVAALRLAEKGYSVVVLEAGRRWADDELPKTSWSIRRFVWAPRLGLHGIQRIVKVGKVLVLAGAGSAADP
jgi:nucleoside-diphosphate-sugar epimerase